MPAFSLESQYFDQEKELSIISALQNNNVLYWGITDYLVPEVFSYENQPKFLEVANLIEGEKNTAIDLDINPSEDPLADAKTLANLYQKRLLAREMEIFFATLPKKDSATDLINDLEKSLVQVQQSIRELKSGDIKTASDMAQEVQKILNEAYAHRQENKSGYKGIPTGVPKLDRMLSGLQKGIHLIAAEPGYGKTTFCLNLAVNAAKVGFPTLFVSFEELLENLTLKAFCSTAKLSFKELMDGQLNPSKFQQAVRENKHYMDLVHFMEGTQKTTVPELKAKALRILNKSGTDRCLIVVDYVQKWAGMVQSQRDFRHIVNALSGELRELSKRLNSPLIAIASQNRQERGSSRLSSLKESGDLEYDADSVWFLTENTDETVKKPARSLWLNIAKNRYGDLGQVPLLFQPQYGLFSELQTS